MARLTVGYSYFYRRAYARLKGSIPSARSLFVMFYVLHETAIRFDFWRIPAKL
jgi:hypothetical protein